jgi:death-on-curing protein
MIDEKTAINIHNILIDKFGGTKGIRDINSLNSALARPYPRSIKKIFIQLK